MRKAAILLLLILTLAGASRGQDPTDAVIWTPLAEAPYNVFRAASARLGNYFYVIGGLGGWTQAIAYNLTTGQWQTATPPVVTGYNWNAVATNDAIYLFPKSFGNGEVQKFTPTVGGPTGNWTLAALYPINTNAFAVAWDGGNYIYCAGSSTSPYGTQAYRMDLNTNAFEALAPLPEGRGWVGGAWVNGKFYVVAGDNPNYQYTNTCFEYNPQNNQWATKAPLPKATAFTCFNTTTDGEKVYVVGGGGGNVPSLPSTDTLQIYDPALDQWSVDLRMNAYGCNSAGWIAEGDWIIDVGGEDLSGAHNCTWKGFLTPPPMALDVTLTFINYVFGGFTFNATVVNNGPVQTPFWVWTRDRFPDGSYTNPLLGPVQVNPPIGQSVTRLRVQNVPSTWPAGLHTYLGYANLTYSYPAVDSSWFTWTKSAPTAGDPWVTEPTCTGEPFPGERSQTAFIPSGLDLGISPNPFNPTTAISYQLSATSRVSLRVYDTAGRLVSTLVEGIQETGQHSVTFDGSKLASGLYFVKMQAGNLTAVQKLMLMK